MRTVQLVFFVMLFSVVVAQGDLFKLARSGTPEQIMASMEAGADVNAVNADGDSILFIAVMSNTPDVVKALLEAGADIAYRNPKTGKDVYALAGRNQQRLEIYKVLDAAHKNPQASSNPKASAASPAKQSAVAEAPTKTSEATVETNADASGWAGFTLTNSKPMDLNFFYAQVSEKYSLDGMELTPEAFAKLCKATIYNRLKAPSTASFMSDKVPPLKQSNGLMMYGFSVDAQNSFGAYIRDTYIYLGHVRDNNLSLGFL